MDKISIPLGPDAWHGYSVETLWATRLESGFHRLENTPFFAMGLSFGDIVETRLSDGVTSFVKTIRAAGRSTYRIIPTETGDQARFQRFWAPLAAAGCSYEQGDFGYQLYAVDVPATADIHHVFALLENGEAHGVWGFEEAHCGHVTGG